jgi:para-aminobenzoate synthetase component 1
MKRTTIRLERWRDPVDAARAADDGDFCALLWSGEGGRWSWLATTVDRIEAVRPDDPRDPFELLRAMLGPRESADLTKDAPPFTGGVIGLLAYEAGARVEPVELRRDPDWPDAVFARVTGLLAFDHRDRVVWAAGRAASEAGARRIAEHAAARLDRVAPRPAHGKASAAFDPEAEGAAYERAVADAVSRIGLGEIFQANLARAWRGDLAAGRSPFEVFARASARAGPHSAWWRWKDLALVSVSPERFLSVRPDGEGLRAQTRPIKGTRRRGADPEADRAAASELQASEKDRAENLMIVDLMRNDLSRVCRTGEVRTEELFRVESYADVHHLVSTVTGRLDPGRDVPDLLRACFPPGSITGAPKVQAMKVISEYEPPRGPWCGTLFWAGFDGAMDSSVLIRTAAFVRRSGRWSWRAPAGAGVVADSDPVAERLETEAKIEGLRRALTEA